MANKIEVVAFRAEILIHTKREARGPDVIETQLAHSILIHTKREARGLSYVRLNAQVIQF